MKKVLIVVSVIAVLFSGCISALVKSSIKDTPLGNKIVIHRNARVGDFAVLQGQHGKSQMTLKVKRYAGALLVVESDTATNPFGLGMKSVAKIEMWVTRGGIVKKGYLVDGKERTQLKIARYGQNEYVKKIPITYALRKKFGIKNRITVPAGTFYVRPVLYRMVKDSKESYSVYMTSNRVKFNQVAAYMYSKNSEGKYQKYSAFELSKHGRSL